MAEEIKNTPQAEGNSETNPSTQADEKQENPLHKNPRFKELIGQKNQWKDEAIETKRELSEYKAKEKAEQEKLLKEKGEFQTILDRKEAEIVSLTKSVKQWDEYKTARSQSHLEELSEDKREIYSALPFDKAEKFYEMEKAKSDTQNAGKTDPSRAGTTAKGEFGGYSSMTDWALKDPDGYEKANTVQTSGGVKIAFGE
tara:strand:- start:2137 stop:2733 length:597 start_codon:yes stop_codon:yes gene_type:complete